MATELTKAKKLALIWKHTHRDFRGKTLYGSKAIMILRSGEGTCLVPLSALTDAEIAEQLAYALRQEEKAKLRYTVVENAGYEGERDVKTCRKYTEACFWLNEKYSDEELSTLHVAVRRDHPNGTREYV